ncbi:MAG: hypothetical protein AAGK01_05875 [Pseudomonadota bacterium]
MPSAAPCQPRHLASLRGQQFSALRGMLYALTTDGQALTDDTRVVTARFISDDVNPCAEASFESNGLGFVIIHPGTAGLSISAHW